MRNFLIVGEEWVEIQNLGLSTILPVLQRLTVVYDY